MPTLPQESKKKMEAAYAADTYAQAKGQLLTLMQTLEARCPKAAASLREGLEERLTLHKLGVAKLLRDRLRTTNIIESINDEFAHTTRRVTRWCNSNQCQRWIAAACLEIEEHSLNSILQAWQWEGLFRVLKRHVKPKTLSYTPAKLHKYQLTMTHPLAETLPSKIDTLEVDHKILSDKAFQIALAAIEAYNKPDSPYREESFTILMVNAWELLLKARILQKNDDCIQSIEVTHTVSGKKKIKKNKSGNSMTIDVLKAAEIVRQYESNKINMACVKNIQLLSEIRDNAVHFINTPKELSMNVYSIGSATLKNFMFAAKKWFQFDFRKFNIFLMPLAFNSLSGVVENIDDSEHSNEINRFLRLIADTETNFSSTDNEDYSVTLKINIKFTRTSGDNTSHVRHARNDPNAVKIDITDDQWMVQYPLNFQELVNQLKSRYENFKRDREFFKIKKKFEENSNFCYKRYPNPKEKKGIPRKYYSYAILNCFDSHYQSMNNTDSD